MRYQELELLGVAGLLQTYLRVVLLSDLDRDASSSIDVSLVFLSLLQATAVRVSRSGHHHFLLNPFRSLIHQSYDVIHWRY
jgi:hypothetical protein